MSTSGFPTRPPRSSFGPDPVNTKPVRDRARELDADIGKLVFHQVAGSGLVGPVAILRFLADTARTIHQRQEAWNPSQESTGAYADPTITRISTGIYTVEYPTPIPDQNGVDVATDLRFALASVVTADDDDMRARAWRVSATTLRVTVRNGAASLVDGEDVALLIW